MGENVTPTPVNPDLYPKIDWDKLAAAYRDEALEIANLTFAAGAECWLANTEWRDA